MELRKPLNLLELSWGTTTATTNDFHYVRGEILSLYVIGVFPSKQHLVKIWRFWQILTVIIPERFGATIYPFETSAIVLFIITSSNKLTVAIGYEFCHVYQRKYDWALYLPTYYLTGKSFPPNLKLLFFSMTYTISKLVNCLSFMFGKKFLRLVYT